MRGHLVGILLSTLVVAVTSGCDTTEPVEDRCEQPESESCPQPEVRYESYLDFAQGAVFTFSLYSERTPDIAPYTEFRSGTMTWTVTSVAGASSGQRINILEEYEGLYTYDHQYIADTSYAEQWEKEIIIDLSFADRVLTISDYLQSESRMRYSFTTTAPDTVSQTDVISAGFGGTTSVTLMLIRGRGIHSYLYRSSQRPEFYRLELTRSG